jgi:hypothetical protein
MKIYVNGCSYTFGDGNTYPNLLKIHYNADLINQSLANASNDRILRTTIDYILNSSIPPDKVVIQWTNVHRFVTIDLDHNTSLLPDKKSTDIFLQKKLIQQMHSLECILKDNYIDDYRFIVWFPVNIDKSISDYCVYKRLDKSKIIFNAYTNLHNLDCNFSINDYHVSSSGHVQIADWIVNNYFSEYITKSYGLPENFYA